MRGEKRLIATRLLAQLKVLVSVLSRVPTPTSENPKGVLSPVFTLARLTGKERQVEPLPRMRTIAFWLLGWQ